MTGLVSFSATVQWGDVPTWLAAVGTVGAFIFTGVLLRRERQDRISSQAKLVAAWMAEERPNTFDVIEGGLEPDEDYLCVKVNNASAEPVYDITVGYDSWRFGSSSEPRNITSRV